VIVEPVIVDVFVRKLLVVACEKMDEPVIEE
jgi:hypothetical protein